MSRQAILSMPLSFAIVLLAAMALSGPARQAERTCPVEPSDDPITVAEASPFVPSEAPVEVTDPITESISDPLPDEEHGHVAEKPDLPNETSPLTLGPSRPEPPPALTTPESVSGRDREHWRPIGPGP